RQEGGDGADGAGGARLRERPGAGTAACGGAGRLASGNRAAAGDRRRGPGGPGGGGRGADAARRPGRSGRRGRGRPGGGRAGCPGPEPAAGPARGAWPPGGGGGRGPAGATPRPDWEVIPIPAIQSQGRAGPQGRRALFGWSPPDLPADTALKRRADRLLPRTGVPAALYCAAVAGLLILAPNLPERGNLAIDGLAALAAGGSCAVNLS